MLSLVGLGGLFVTIPIGFVVLLIDLLAKRPTVMRIRRATGIATAFVAAVLLIAAATAALSADWRGGRSFVALSLFAWAMAWILMRRRAPVTESSQ
jgi:hypothetical protein